MTQTVLDNLNELVPLLRGRRFLLVRGRSYDGLKLKAFFDAFPHEEFTEFKSNPLYEQVLNGVDFFNRTCCDLIVAVGGGSAIDVAKCIKLFCLQSSAHDRTIDLIAIPTTAGTGSESTRHAVIYKEGVKQSISSEDILPDYIVLLPQLLRELPLYQKKCTMLDALCQAIESWWSVNSTDESIGYSKIAIESIRENWQAYIFENTDSAAEKIMRAANYAGRAINITATTAAHAMSYKITSMYNFPHGHAVAVCMPEVWGYMLEHTEDCIDGRGVEYLRKTLRQIADMLDLDYFKSMMEKLEMQSPVAADRGTELDILAQSVNPVRLKNNPVALSTEVLKDMYGRIVK